MDALTNILASYRPVTGSELRIVEAQEHTYTAVNPQELRVDVATDGAARLVVVHNIATSSLLTITLAEGARLHLTEIFTAEAFSEVTIRQGARSECQVTSLLLGSAKSSYRVDLEGCEAESAIGGLFLVAGEEHATLHLATRHSASDCRSVSLAKGVAAGRSVGEFCGHVYVAQDAQRTDAQQQSRNILLSETARIVTRPQLEIYADDVKCSHGATVGQMDADAILYMRQRGLSEEQARRVQIEGFAGDVVRRCGDDELAETLMGVVAAKMEKM